MSHVVDTSVVLKWIVREAGSDAARSWVGASLAAPDFIRAELANALWKKVRIGEIEPHQALRGLEHGLEPVSLVPTMPLVERALPLALTLAHPVYDCIFLTLAESLNMPLLTADKKLWTQTRRTSFNDRVVLLTSRELEDGG